MLANRIMIVVGALAFLIQGTQLRAAQYTGPSAADAFVSVAVSFGVPGGVAWEKACSPSSLPPLYATGNTLDESLNSIVKADARYRWIRRDGVVNLIPKRGIPLFLRTRIRRFDSKGATNGTSAASSLLRLPEVRKAELALRIDTRLNHIPLGLMPGPTPGKQPSKPRELNIHLRNTTLFGALNSIVRAEGHGVWLYREWHCNGRHGFDISFSHLY